MVPKERANMRKKLYITINGLFGENNVGDDLLLISVIRGIKKYLKTQNLWPQNSVST